MSIHVKLHLGINIYSDVFTSLYTNNSINNILTKNIFPQKGIKFGQTRDAQPNISPPSGFCYPLWLVQQMNVIN